MPIVIAGLPLPGRLDAAEDEPELEIEPLDLSSLPPQPATKSASATSASRTAVSALLLLACMCFSSSSLGMRCGGPSGGVTTEQIVVTDMWWSRQGTERARAPAGGRERQVRGRRGRSQAASARP